MKQNRGLYKNSTAVKMWNDRDYLPSAFGETINIPVVRDATVGTLQDDRKVESFSSSFRRLFDSEYSKVWNKTCVVVIVEYICCCRDECHCCNNLAVLFHAWPS